MDDKDDSGGLLPEKDSIYRFLSMPMIDCNEITSKLASVIQDEIRLPGSEWHFVLDDSAYKRNRSKNAELATKCFDHTGHTYFSGYRMLTFGIIDGTTFMPISQINMS